MDPIAQLTVTNDAPFARRGDRIVWGVPLIQGRVSDPEQLVLYTAAGRRLPCWAEGTARWADGSAKWVLLTVPNIDLAAGETLELTLGTGRRRRLGTTLRLTRNARGVRVDTGKLRFTICRTGPLISRIEVLTAAGWRVRARSLGLHMRVERGGQPVEFSAEGEADRAIAIEVSGPERAVVRVDGTHRSMDGNDTFGPYTLRFGAAARTADLRLTHSVIFDGDPDRDYVCESSVSLEPVVGGKNMQFAFGADDGAEVRVARQRASFCPDLHRAELYQDSATHWGLERWADPERRSLFTAQGQRSDGWLEVSGSAGRVAMCVRECWQNHPKSLSVDAAAGVMKIGLYPDRAEPLNLSRYSACSYPWTYEHPAFRGKASVVCDPGCGAHGIRKTHDILLTFDCPTPSAAAYGYNHPLRLEWSPAYTAQTRVVMPATGRLNRRWLKRVNEWSDFLHEEMLSCGGTGYVDYFDLPHGFDIKEGRWFHDFGGFGYINDEAMLCLGFWQAYLLTGRRDVFDMARAMARHNGDIDSYMMGPWAGYGSRHNPNHWGDTCKERRVSQPIGRRFLYYLLGDRSVLDLNRVVLDSFIRPPAGPINMTCDVACLVSSLLLAEESGEEDGEAWLLALADAVAASFDGLGRLAAFLHVDGAARSAAPVPDAAPIGFMMHSCFGGVQALAELGERYDHSALREGLVRYARYQMRPGKERARLEPEGQAIPSDILNTFRALDLYGYAYAVTGDRVFRNQVRAHSRHIHVALERRDESRYDVPDVGTRVTPVLVPAPDRSPEQDDRWRHSYPLFAPESAGQLFNMAVYLHKIQALMLLDR